MRLRASRSKGMRVNIEPNPADSAPKPMKGKYDRRKNNGATRARRRVNPNLGRKPQWMKHISRNAAYHILQDFESIATFKDIYAYCWEHKKVELMISMREYAWNRLEGRPFVAENPAATRKPDGLLQDNRLPVAIQNLMLQPPASETQKAPRTR